MQVFVFAMAAAIAAPVQAPKSVADGSIRIPPKTQVADGSIRIPPRTQVADGSIRIPPRTQVA